MIIGQNQLIIKMIDDQNLKINDVSINKIKKLIDNILNKFEKIT